VLDIEDRFVPEARRLMVDSIRAAGGNEVFFVGQVNADGLIAEVRVAARGNEGAVPLVRQALAESDVLIHNHPSGNLTPSDADLDVAGRVSADGLGFYIVDNAVENVYAVIEPIATRECRALDIPYVRGLLDEGGPLAAQFASFERRDGQIALTDAIARAFNESGVGVFEAGTGVGKSFAYLVPAMLWAAQNEERVVISTGTINLQQQLIEKDIPAAQKTVGIPVKTVLVKGRQNYVCLRRLGDALADARASRDFFEDETAELEKIAEWANKTADGSRSDLGFMPAEGVWSRVCSESDACMGMRCSYRESCFIMRVRKDAASASLLVVNHHLLFADLEARMAGAGYDDSAVLPPFHRVVFDEAHGIEDAATSFFSEYFTRYKLLKQLAILYRVRRGSISGHLILLERMSESPGAAQNAIAEIASVKELYTELEEVALSLLADSFTWRLSPKTSAGAVRLLGIVAEFRAKIAKLAGFLRDVFDGIADEDQDAPAVWESKFVLKRLENIGSLCLSFVEWSERPDSVFWIEKNRLAARNPRGGDEPVWFPRFVQTPLQIAPMMREAVFEPFKTVVCTSATLRIANRFDYWLNRAGVSFVEAERVRTGVFESPFPYEKNVLFSVPNDAPLPDDPAYQPWVETAVVKLLRASAGHALVLFTSYELLRSCCEIARSELSGAGITVLRQGEDDRTRLLETFRSDESSVLFATDSFWEGVDAPGDALLHVIIAKLPFRVPSDPVHAARSEAIDSRGGNAFMELSLPEAIVRFRQGFGRLMRRQSDYGAVTVLDRRILAKRYGSLFLESIPKTARCMESLATIEGRVERFLYD